MNMEKLMKPRSIAVVGVTDKPGFGRGAANGALISRIADHAYFVHPKREALFGKKCYPSITALPEVVDCVVLCTASKTIPGLLTEAGEKGIGAAIIYASGFSEEGTEEGHALEDEVKAIAARYSAAAASLYLSSLSLGMTIAKLLFGWLNDKIGVRWNFLAMSLLSLTGIVTLLLSRSPALTIIGVMLFGVGAASPFVLTPQLTIRLFGGRDFANLYGTINVFQFLGPALGPVISGAIYDRTGSYTAAFMLYACVLAIAIVIGTLLLAKAARADRARA